MANQWFTVYAKYDGNKTYKAFDINEGRFAGNIINATQIEDTEDNRRKLQRIVDNNRNINLHFELRGDKGKVAFSTERAIKNQKITANANNAG